MICVCCYGNCAQRWCKMCKMKRVKVNKKLQHELDVWMSCLNKAYADDEVKELLNKKKR